MFQEWGEGGKEENDRGGEFKYDIFDIRTFVNATKYPKHNNKTKQNKQTSKNPKHRTTRLSCYTTLRHVSKGI
jgi:hypothetical protein